MAFDVSWFVESRVIQARVSGTIAPEDGAAFSAAIAAYLDDGAPPVHILMDLHQVTGLTPSFNIRRVVRTVRHLDHPHLEWTVLITTSKMTHFLASFLYQFHQARLAHAADFNEALARLREVDYSLAALLPEPEPPAPPTTQ